VADAKYAELREAILATVCANDTRNKEHGVPPTFVIRESRASLRPDFRAQAACASITAAGPSLSNSGASRSRVMSRSTASACWPRFTDSSARWLDAVRHRHYGVMSSTVARRRNESGISWPSVRSGGRILWMVYGRFCDGGRLDGHRYAAEDSWNARLASMLLRLSRATPPRFPYAGALWCSCWRQRSRHLPAHRTARRYPPITRCREE